MKVVKFLVSALITLVLVYLFDNSWNLKGIPVPAIGRFLDPYHGFWQNIESRESRPIQQLKIKGLKDKVTVAFDSLMIPHISASNDTDLYLTQGYITAMHRLWQMEFQTHAAAGRVSEIIASDATLDYDRRQRRYGMVYGAKRALEEMEKDSILRNAVLAYTDGINRYIETLTYGQMPLEYKLLNYSPEAWTPLKCALLLKHMAQTLNMGDKDIEMTNTLKLFGKEYVALLFPDREDVGDPIVDNPGAWNFKPITLDTIPLAIPQDYNTVNNKPVTDPTMGSNNWAVAGRKTKTGAPLLCNDPHLQLNLPSIWYVAQLTAPGINVMGASLPGAPGIVIGFNDSIAWGVTNAQRDLVDWFKITYQDNQREKYLLDSQWINTEKVIEEIKIKGKGVYKDTVIYTQWGPVTYDESFHPEDQLKNYAFRWVAHDPSEELKTFYLLNRAKSHADYMKALNYYSSPGQNFIFASVSGDIALRIQGKFPVRRPLEGKFVLDGSKSDNGWQAFIPNEQNIMYKNPARGFVSSANQYPVDSTYPYYITATSYEAYRNRRINEVLNKQEPLGVEDMMRLQNDNYNLKAAESLPYMLGNLDSTKLSQDEKVGFDILKTWNFTNNRNSIGASYYEAWWNNLMPMIWDELKTEEGLSKPTAFTTIKLLKEKPDLIFFDIKNTDEKETAKEVIRKSFSLAIEDIAEWKKTHSDTVRWGEYKDSYIAHLLPPMKALSIPVKTGGNRDIVNAHSKTHGPSWRMIVSLEPGSIKAWGVYPGGQSGNPGSKYYNNLLNSWTQGKYYNLQFLKDQNFKEDTNKLVITTINPQ
ncbi:penicillin acylase family protein [Chryseosolibacter indicus]|uniref:Penicillin acylase family protein n=1 Tax=Chryseosolibacter indicus TaxID=2782351 RepID=A0ABS5VVG3_9BACT|nr:penicillin acylase family protein [Chryseosolibacter indicus]MBT1704864.1 penicillin acylase family protein [Chryseosolibacter indicus]